MRLFLFTIAVSLVALVLPPSFALKLDETSAKPGEWGYRPVDGESAEMNPPGFSWRPMKGAVRYRLQVARDKEFDNVVYAREHQPFSAHCPSKCFEVGTYFWRYRATVQGETAENVTDWSRIRSFVITRESVPFPCPAIENLIQRIPQGHPRLMFVEKDLSHLRELGDGPLSDRQREVLDQADKILETPPDSTEPPMYPEGTKFKSEEWKKIWWGNRLRTIAVADGAATLGFAYRLSGEEKYGRAARDLILAMTKWDTDGSTNYEYNDEAAMPALKMTSRAYTWAFPFFGDADREKVAQMMRARGRDCYNHLRGREHLWTPFASHSNRAWHFLGEVATAFYGEIPEAEEWLEYAMTVLYCVYPAWGDSDGGWHEGAGYWSSYIRRFLHWSLTLESTFGIDIFQRPFFQKTGNFALYIMPPGSQSGGFGDMGGHTTAKSIAPFMDLLGASAQNPNWIWFARSEDEKMEGGYLGYLFSARVSSIAPEPPSDLPSSAVFRGVGVAALNTNLLDGNQNTQILFKSSPMGRQSHGYNANNSFVLNLKGERVLLCSGKRDIHGSPHHTEWMWESKADNSILVNGQGQIKHSPDSTGVITSFNTSDRIDVVVGEAAHSYRALDRFTRRIVFLKPHAILIHDILDASEASTFQFNLHAKGPFEMGENRLKWEGDPGVIEVDFLEPAGLILDQTDEYSTPPHEWANFDLGEWHLTADAPEKVKHREFLTLIRIQEVEVGVEVQPLEDGTRRIDLALPEGRTATLTLGLEGFRVQDAGEDWSF